MLKSKLENEKTKANGNEHKATDPSPARRIETPPKSYQDIQIGDYHELSVNITGELIESFATMTGDFNPIHMDEDYALGTLFKKRIAHGLLPLSFVGTIFGTVLPGPGSIYLYQNVEFKSPVFLGDSIKVRVEVVTLDSRTPKVTLKTTIVNQDGKLVIDGEGAILFKPVKEKV